MKSDKIELSSLELLRDFAEVTGRIIETTEDKLTSTGFLSHQHTKRTAFIPFDSGNHVVFHWYNNPKGFSAYSMYCGILFTTNIKENIQICFRKRFFVDCMNFNLSEKRHKTGYEIFDSKCTITGENFDQIYHLLKPDLLNTIIELFETDQRIRILINSFSPDFGPFKNQKNLTGIVIKDFWIFDSTIIEKMFQISIKLKNYL